MLSVYDPKYLIEENPKDLISFYEIAKFLFMDDVKYWIDRQKKLHPNIIIDYEVDTHKFDKNIKTFLTIYINSLNINSITNNINLLLSQDDFKRQMIQGKSGIIRY